MVVPKQKEILKPILSIIDRLKSGKGIAIFGFDENSEECMNFLEEIKSIDGLVHFEIPEYISKYNLLNSN